MSSRIAKELEEFGIARLPHLVGSQTLREMQAAFAGRLTGKLVVEEKLEVGATAVIRADIVARTIAIAKGAVIDGTVTLTSGEGAVEFEEKRSAR